MDTKGGWKRGGVIEGKERDESEKEKGRKKGKPV